MNAKKDNTRLYIVRDKIAEVAEGQSAPIVALVRGINVNQVTRHMAEKSFSVEYAEQGALIAAVKAGVEEESAIETDGEKSA